jgi:hypothetical protein
LVCIVAALVLVYFVVAFAFAVATAFDSAFAVAFAVAMLAGSFASTAAVMFATHPRLRRLRAAGIDVAIFRICTTLRAPAVTWIIIPLANCPLRTLSARFSAAMDGGCRRCHVRCCLLLPRVFFRALAHEI